MAGRSRAIMHIIKKYDGKRVPKKQRQLYTSYEFSNAQIAGQACWTIHGETGRQCVADGRYLTVYT